jgi:hypothetical protein
MYEKEEKILTAFKRRSAEFFSKHEREEEQQAQQVRKSWKTGFFNRYQEIEILLLLLLFFKLIFKCFNTEIR